MASIRGLRGDGIVLHFHYGGSDIWENWLEVYTYTHTNEYMYDWSISISSVNHINVNFMVLIFTAVRQDANIGGG